MNSILFVERCSGLHCCSACVVFAKGARHGRRPYIETDNGEMNSPLQETRSPLRTGTGVPCPYKRKKARASGGGSRRDVRFWGGTYLMLTATRIRSVLAGAWATLTSSRDLGTA